MTRTADEVLKEVRTDIRNAIHEALQKIRRETGDDFNRSDGGSITGRKPTRQCSHGVLFVWSRLGKVTEWTWTPQYFICPVNGCDYRTPASGPRDVAARNAVMAHLQRKRHGYSYSEAKEAACRAPFAEKLEKQ